MTYPEARKVTIWELNLRLEGYREQNELEWMRFAQLACWVTAPHVKKVVNPEQLIKLNKGNTLTREEKQSDVERKMNFYNRIKNG